MKKVTLAVVVLLILIIFPAVSDAGKRYIVIDEENGQWQEIEEPAVVQKKDTGDFDGSSHTGKLSVKDNLSSPEIPEYKKIEGEEKEASFLAWKNWGLGINLFYVAYIKPDSYETGSGGGFYVYNKKFPYVYFSGDFRQFDQTMVGQEAGSPARIFSFGLGLQYFWQPIGEVTFRFFVGGKYFILKSPFEGAYKLKDGPLFEGPMLKMNRQLSMLSPRQWQTYETKYKNAWGISAGFSYFFRPRLEIFGRDVPMGVTVMGSAASFEGLIRGYNDRSLPGWEVFFSDDVVEVLTAFTVSF